MSEFEKNFENPENEPAVAENSPAVPADAPVQTQEECTPTNTDDVFSEQVAAVHPENTTAADIFAEPFSDNADAPAAESSPALNSEAEPISDAGSPAPDVASYSYPPVSSEPQSFTPGAPFVAPKSFEPAFTPVKVTPPEKVPNSGLKLFLALICVVVALCIAVTAGYMAGRNYKGTGNQVSTELAQKPDTSEMNNAQIVFENTKACTVGITTFDSGFSKQSLASGVIYSADGYIVTNDHIMADVVSPRFFITTWDGQEYEAEFVAGDSRSDLAVLKANGSFTPAQFGDSSLLEIGEEVVSIGYPGTSTIGPILTKGTISATSRRVTTTNSSYSPSMIQTDAAINPGSSGGALVNMYSQVVGITSSKLAGSEYDRVGFAIPTTTMKKVVDSLINNGNVADRARLGITYMSITKPTSIANNMPCGLYISSISADSDLSGKGVSSGDVITHINDIPITNSNIALDIIDNSKPGDVLVLTVTLTSSGSSVNVSTTLLSDPGSSNYTETAASNSGAEFNN